MKKVLLVNTNMEKIPYPVPPLGLAMIAQSIEHSFEVKFYDGVFDEGNHFEAMINDFQPDYICFSIRNVDNMAYHSPEFFPEKINEVFIKPARRLSNAVFIAGGSGFSVFPYELLNFFNIPYGITGEGEIALPALLNALEANTKPGIIPGVVLRNNKTESNIATQIYAPSNLVSDPETFRFINIHDYVKRGAYAVQTKRGCTHQCIYCTYPHIEGKKFRVRNPSDIVSEIEKAAGRTENMTFEFVDSVFNDPPGHAEAVCNEIIKRKLKIKIRAMGINPAHASQKLFSLMREAGFTQIDCTPDTASPFMLKMLGKNFNIRQLRSTASIIRQNDLPTMWFFVFGGPGENQDSINETFEFIDSFINENDLVHIASGLRIYPNTRLYQHAIADNIITKSDSLLKPHFYINPVLGIHQLNQILHKKISTRFNVLMPPDNVPSAEMMQEALTYRQANKVEEPMFRTLLRIRKQMINNS